MGYRKFIKLFACLMLLNYTLTAEATTYHVYPKATILSEKNSVAGFSEWKFPPQPGDVILLYGNKGDYKENLLLFGINGLVENPIRIQAAQGNQPIIKGFIALLNSSHLIIEGLTIIANKDDSAVQIRQNSHNIIIKSCTIQNSGIGVWISDKAGMMNQIIGNTISGNYNHGIAVDLVNCKPGQETIFAKNRIFKNGVHGIEINANYYIIESNEVFKNGGRIIGTSGIHTYSKTAMQDAGDYNIIRYNMVYDNIEKDSGPDGNGIQLDQWCDYNQVYYNICFNNDGAGISIFDSSDSKIFNNIIFGNGRRRKSEVQPFKAELFIGSDFVNKTNHTRNVQIINNIIVGDDPDTYSLYVDRLTSNNNLIFENNLFFHLKRENFYFWKDKYGNNFMEFSELPGFKDNRFGPPLFISHSPRSIKDFKLQNTSPAINHGQRLNLFRDITGTAIYPNKLPNIGAIDSEE